MEGHGASDGRFIWQCRTCTRTFEEDDHQAAEKHGLRCAAQLSKRQWSCRCNGALGNGAKLMATQCTECSKWFHSSCKMQETDWWDLKKAKRDVCAACESAAGMDSANVHLSTPTHDYYSIGMMNKPEKLELRRGCEVQQLIEPDSGYGTDLLEIASSAPSTSICRPFSKNLSGTS